MDYKGENFKAPSNHWRRLKDFVSSAWEFPEPHVEEELGNSYRNWNDDSVSQGRYDSDVQKPWFRNVFSFIPGLGAASEPEPGISSAWYGSSDIDSEGGLLRSMTPSFLRQEDEDDYASACCPNLGFKTRIFGCACCLVLGQLIQFCSFGAFSGVLMGHPGRFACLYTMGNFTMLASSFFLSGPAAQCRKIKAKDRFKTSAIFMVSMLFTLVVVFSRPFWGRAIIIMFCVAVQWFALVWYVLSFIPYGQTIGRRVLRGICACCLRM